MYNARPCSRQHGRYCFAFRSFVAVRIRCAVVCVYSSYLLLRSLFYINSFTVVGYRCASVIDVQSVGSMTYLIFFSKHCDCILFLALVLSQQFSPSVIMAKIELTIRLVHQVFRFHFVVCLRIISIFVHNLLSTLKFCSMNCLFQQTLRSILFFALEISQ